MENSLMVLFPYKEGSIWAFDDAATGLVREPFVGAINAMIDALVVDIPDANQGIAMTFSANEFPGAQIGLRRTRGDMGGNWYIVESCDVEGMEGIEGWLCPALFKYFPEAPDQIFASIGQKQ